MNGQIIMLQKSHLNALPHHSMIKNLHVIFDDDVFIYFDDVLKYKNKNRT